MQTEFEQKFLLVSVPYIQAAEGLVSVSAGRPTQWAPDEYVMTALWESLSCLRSSLENIGTRR
jgi:hypothetical protein